mgnify:CR=1 FL=1
MYTHKHTSSWWIWRSRNVRSLLTDIALFGPEQPIVVPSPPLSLMTTSLFKMSLKLVGSTFLISLYDKICQGNKFLNECIVITKTTKTSFCDLRVYLQDIFIKVFIHYHYIYFASIFTTYGLDDVRCFEVAEPHAVLDTPSQDFVRSAPIYTSIHSKLNNPVDPPSTSIHMAKPSQAYTTEGCFQIY